MKTVISLLLCAACCACTTLEDFHSMSPDQRERIVCNKQPDIKSLAREEYRAARNIEELSLTLAQGYKLVTTCKTIDVETWVQKQCKPREGKKHDSENCSREKEYTQKRVCEEQVVKIHPRLIQDQLAEQKQLHEQLSLELDERYQQCATEIADLPVDAAYQRYLNAR